MKVERISANSLYNQSFNSKFKSPLDIKDTYTILKDVVWDASQEEFPKKYAENASLFLNLIKNMSGIDYLNLTAKQKDILDKVMPDYIIRDADRNYDIAFALKTYMERCVGDFKYYTILSVGRSLAACCETLKHMGADVKFPD